MDRRPEQERNLFVKTGDRRTIDPNDSKLTYLTRQETDNFRPLAQFPCHRAYIVGIREQDLVFEAEPYCGMYATVGGMLGGILLVIGLVVILLTM